MKGVRLLTVVKEFKVHHGESFRGAGKREAGRCLGDGWRGVRHCMGRGIGARILWVFGRVSPLDFESRPGSLEAQEGAWCVVSCAFVAAWFTLVTLRGS